MPRYTDNYNLILPDENEHYDVEVANANNTSIDNILKNKVESIAGKGLSSCDFTVEYKRKVDNLHKIHKPKGSVKSYEDLTEITDSDIGDIYSVLDEKQEYSWNGTEWYLLGDLMDLSECVKRPEMIAYVNTTQNTNKYTVTTSSAISENTDYTIPCNYKVGADVLDVYYMGEKLIKNVHYIEVGNTGAISNKIQFYNWGQSVPTGRTIELIVRGVYN